MLSTILRHISTSISPSQDGNGTGHNPRPGLPKFMWIMSSTPPGVIECHLTTTGIASQLSKILKTFPLTWLSSAQEVLPSPYCRRRLWRLLCLPCRNLARAPDIAIWLFLMPLESKNTPRIGPKNVSEGFRIAQTGFRCNAPLIPEPEASFETIM